MVLQAIRLVNLKSTQTTQNIDGNVMKCNMTNLRISPEADEGLWLKLKDFWMCGEERSCFKYTYALQISPQKQYCDLQCNSVVALN